MAASLMKSYFSLLALLATVIQVFGQGADFISIDCGHMSLSYQDSATSLTFTPDETYVDAGIRNPISPKYKTPSLTKQFLTVRSFPNGSRNCYTLPAKKSEKYLLRASFLYGDYDDGLTMKNNKNIFMFGLHIGIDSWANVSIEDSSLIYTFEAITVAPANFISICLINTNQAAPFISSLEMRPLNSSLYPAVSPGQTLALSFRYNIGPKEENIIRYPDDSYDRIWSTYDEHSSSDWTEITSNGSVKYLSNDFFHVPPSVLLTAIEPVGLHQHTDPISIKWFPNKHLDNPKYYLILHFCELSFNSTLRELDIYFNDEQIYMSNKSIIANYLEAESVYSIIPNSGRASYHFDVYASDNSSSVPLLNAVEIYYMLSMSAAFTFPTDAMAMKAIKRAYSLTTTSWQGDPCGPIGYTWDHVVCTSVNNTLRITSIDLSHNKLTGEISIDLSILTELVFLDLSYNSLSGPIPDFLGSLASLKFLNLSGNCFSGPIPSDLLGNDTGLILRYDEYNACKDLSSKSNHTIAIAIPSAVIATLLVAVLVFFIWRKLRKTQERNTSFGAIPMSPLFATSPHFKDYPSINEKRPYEDELQLSDICRFSYQELEKMSNNFARFIGKGGFGPVFHGYLKDKKEIAIKTHASSSNHGMEQFIAEVVFLAKIHHRNLVQLVGYCMEDTTLALVYEYMSQGCITDHLRGKDVTITLSWRQRLQIALDAAQGLDYLHTGCEAPIIHRDVKSSNILLDHNLHAKIADFGLSKAFEDNKQTHMSTMPAGTLGYMDIEYYKTGRLTEKSDVYSFGIVLLELVTGEPPIDQEKGHLTNRVNEMVTQGDIDSITDNKLGGSYEINSVWKVLEIAMHCANDLSQKRPTMNEVVTQLKESLALEIARENCMNIDTSITSTGSGTGTATSTDTYLFSAGLTVPDAVGPVPR